MKKFLCLLLVFLALFPLASCGNVETETETAAEDSNVKAELDLTLLSNTLIFSELQNITSNPGNYDGWTIRMRGQCQTYYNELQNAVYHAVTVADAASCCAQGLEYVLSDEAAYPDDGVEVTITGEFVSYEEMGYIYYHLVNANVSM